MEAHKIEHRRFTRVFPHVEAELTHLEAGIIPCETRDVSMKGVSVDGCKPLQVGTDCELTFYLGGRQSGKRIEIRGRVVRCDSSGLAIEFLEIYGMDSYEHLRNLVFYNARIGDDVDSEFRDSLGLRMPVQYLENNS
ncbi:MAG: PilZ domain-containing protein [Candidatus Ozemobacteraceae bacterium]